MGLSTEYILTLLKTPKIGQVSAKYISSNLNHTISGLNELYDFISELKGSKPKLPLPSLEALQYANHEANLILTTCEKSNIAILNSNEYLYPAKLKRLDDYPIIVYLRGALDSISNSNAVAVIGTREPTEWGVKAGRRMATIFAEHGFTIISGLAIGCDTAGHLGAIDAKKPTVAVLASGVDVIYPRENQYLAEKILETGGSLLSEYEPGFKPHKSSFVERDRLQSGLSNGLIIVETDVKGGTMHTVGFAHKINVPIACVLHPESMRQMAKTKGNSYLIENGATALGNNEQIINFMSIIQNLTPTDITLEDIKKIEVKLREDKLRNSNQKLVTPDNITSEDSFLKSSEPIEEEIVISKQLVEEQPDQLSIEELLKEIDELKLVVEHMEHRIANMAIEQKNLNKILDTLIKKGTKEKSSKKTESKQPKLL